ncbi:MAG: hypothetical protein V1646_03890 [bacterium]
MQKMLKKILKIVFLLVFLDVSVWDYAMASQAVPADAGDMAKLSALAKLKKGIAAKARESIQGAKDSIEGAKSTLKGVKAVVTGKQSVKGFVAEQQKATKEKAVKEAVEKAAEKAAEEAKKTPEQKAAEKEAAEKEAALASKTPQERIAYLQDPSYLAKTPAQKIAYLMKTALQLGGESEDPADKGYWDRIFLEKGEKIAARMAKVSVPIMEKALKLNQAFKDSRVGQLQKKANDVSRSVKADMYKLLPGNKSRKDIEEERATPEAKKKHASLVAKYMQSGMSEEDAQKEAQRNIQEEIDKAVEDQLDKIAAKKISDIEAQNPKKYATIMSRVAKKLAEGEEKESMGKEKTEGEKKYKELLDKVKENVKLSSSEIEKLLENPGTKNLLMRQVLKEEIKEGLKTTWYGKYQDDLQKRRQKFMSTKIQGVGLAISSLVQMAALLIGKEVEKAAKDMYLKPEVVVDKKSSEIEQAEVSYGVDKLTPEDQKNMDILNKLADFYSAMDVRFKSVISKFDYEDTVFQTAQKVKYSGGVFTAGMTLLFDYKGAGNIADGLTPVVVGFYPMEIAGDAIDPAQALVGVGNVDALELVSAMRSCRPDLIFFIKAISLLNAANKKITDVAQRQAFLSEQMNLLFARFIRTVDDEATRRANIIEKDDEKWESVYMDNPAECFGSAPKVLRDFMQELTVDTLDADGKVVKISFEEYIIDQFNEFDDVINVEFEGDVDYEVEAQDLDDTEVRLRLYAIFSRALDDVLRLEKELFEEKSPVKIQDAQGKEQIFNSKKFYMDVTKVAFNNLQKLQKKFLDATVEYGSDMTDANNLKAYNSAFKDYMSALDAYSKAELEFRKKVTFYPFEKTLGYAPERVLDFVKRECKRAYQEAENKEYFRSVLPKVFEPFSRNFPFSVQDLLKYSQEPGAVKSPVRLFVAETLPQVPEKTESKKTESGDLRVTKQVLDEVVSEEKSTQVTSPTPVNSITIKAQDKESPKEIFGVNQVKPKGKIIQVYTPPASVKPTPDKVPEKVETKVPEKVKTGV